MTSENSKNTSDEIIKRAKKRFEIASEAESEIRKEALEDQKFRSGDQWPLEIKNSREQDARPCLTINRLPQFLRQITNDQRQNRPSIKVDPVDDKGDVDTARIIQGLIRHIEYSSNAEVAYDTASDGQVTGGFGYFRFVTDYESPLSFKQEIKFKRIRNPMTVYFDPSAQEPDGSDANWAIVADDLSKEEFQAQFPNADLCTSGNWKGLGDSMDWVSEDKCRVIEYFERTYKSVKLFQLSDGSAVPEDKMPAQLPEGLSIVSERETEVPEVKWYKLNDNEILDQTDWLGKWIPIVPVYGDEVIVDGKRILEGVIRHARDPQRMYNYWASAETETIALAPRAPWIVAEGQVEGHESAWASANTKNHSVLQYKQKDLEGNQAPPPQRNVYEAPVQAITQARMASADDLKATTGIYDASLGNRSNEVSGTAIQRRTTQAQVSNFHYTDNFTRSLRHAGRILIDLIPKIYDAPQAIRIIGDEGNQEVVKINQYFKQAGQDKIYKLSAGCYDVTVSTGPNYQTKRQEAVASMLDLVRSVPQAMQPTLDLLVQNMDWPGAQEVSARLKKMLPPGLADGDDKDQPPIPPQVQQQLMQMNTMIQRLQGERDAATKIIETKSIELASKERIEMAKIKAGIEINLAKMGSQSAEAILDHQVDEINRRQDLLGEQVPLGPQDQNMNQQPTGGLPPGQPPPGGQPMGV